MQSSILTESGFPFEWSNFAFGRHHCLALVKLLGKATWHSRLCHEEWEFKVFSICKRRSIEEKWNKVVLFNISCFKNEMFWLSSELHSWRKIIFVRSRNLSGVVNNSDFWDMGPVYYFTSLLKNVSCTSSLAISEIYRGKKKLSKKSPM